MRSRHFLLQNRCQSRSADYCAHPESDRTSDNGSQFRHAAAAIYLKHRPGDYETVRRLLGHRDIQTTIRFYCGLETMQATEQFGKLIRQQIKFDPIEA
jgi:integrase